MNNEQTERREAVLAVAKKGLDVARAAIELATADSVQVSEVAQGVTALAIEVVQLLDDNARLQAEIERLSVPWWRRWRDKVALRTVGAKRIG